MQTEVKDFISDTTQRINKKQWLIPPSRIEDSKRSSCGDSDLLFKFCMDNSVVPARIGKVNCLCPVIKEGSQRWRFSCENDPSRLAGFRVLDHVVFFRDINPPKKIVLAVGQPYFQSLDKSEHWDETLTQWGNARGLRVVLNNGPGASWWNPGAGEEPHLGHCIRIEFWNDSKMKAGKRGGNNNPEGNNQHQVKEVNNDNVMIDHKASHGNIIGTNQKRMEEDALNKKLEMASLWAAKGEI